MTDAELVKACRLGDADAFADLVREYRAPVLRLCRRITGDRAEAEELAHDSFVEAYLKLHQLRDPTRFGAWVRTTALNVCRMWLRRRRWESPGLESDDITHPAPDAPVGSHDMAASIAELPYGQRLAVVLYHLEGLTYREIASFLGVPIGTVMSRLNRARSALREALDDMDQDDAAQPVDASAFAADIRGEVLALTGGFRGQFSAAKRLSVLLGRSPERLRELMSVVPDDDGTWRALARAAAIAGARALDEPVRMALGRDEGDRARALCLLTHALNAGAQPGSAARTWNARAGAAATGTYAVADRVIAADATEASRADLVMALLERCDHVGAANLLSESLLCWPDESWALVSQAGMNGRGPSSSTSLVATWARFGGRFWREMAHRLAGDADAAARALTVVETAARLFQHHSGRESENGRTGEAIAAHPLPRWLTDPSPEPMPEWATVPTRALSDTADALAASVTVGDCPDRARALRVLGWLDDGSHQDTVRAHVAHDDEAMCVAAIHALSPGDERSTRALIGLVASTSGRTRVAAVQALARQGMPNAVPAMVALAGEDDRELGRLVVTALAGLAGEHTEARAALERLSGSPDPWTSRLAQSELAAASRPSVAHRTSPSAVRPHSERQRTRGSMHHMAVDAAMRALPEVRAYGDAELTERIANVCSDWCATRRELVDLRLMRRESNRYEFTPLGEAIWRVEHYIMEHYLRG